MDKVRMLFANPGQDMTREIRLCWHSDVERCLLQVSGLPSQWVQGKLTDIDYPDHGPYYKFEHALTGLTPDSEYTYTVTAENFTTEERRFRTGRETLSPGVIGIFSDVHMMPEEESKVGICDDLLDKLHNLVGEPDFVIFCGDVVQRGAYYRQWELFAHPRIASGYTMAPVAGNHDYYLTDKVRRDNSRFLAICNTPENGAPEVRTSYYFITNRILFPVLDPVMEECTSATATQRDLANQEKWLRGVFEANEGKYDYIVVLQHYPHFVADEGGSIGWGGYHRWRELFDEFGVDLAISGDYHCYVCSKPLYGNAPVEPGQGTVYVSVPMIATSYYPSVFSGNDRVEWLDVLDENRATTGACYLKVNDRGLEFATFDGEGNVRHNVRIPARNRNKSIEAT